MTTDDIRGGKDTWAGAGHPDLTRNRAQRLALQAGSAEAFILLDFDAPEGAVVLSAQVTVWAAGPSTGDRALTLRPVATWKAAQLTWNNRPAVTGAGVTVDVADLADGAPVTWDVTTDAQAVVDGADHYGWKITTDSATRHKVYGFDSDDPPRLRITYALPPAAPSGLCGGSGFVSVEKPTFTFDYADTNNGDLRALRIQVDPGEDETSPDYDSGWVETTEPEIVLGDDTAYPTFGGLPGTDTAYRVAVRDENGQESDWSDWVPLFGYAPVGALTITAPAATTVKDITPTISWNPENDQFAYRVVVMRDGNRGKVLHDTGARKSTATAYTIPKGVIVDEATSYRVEVYSWDTNPREGTPAAPAYAKATKVFTIADGATGAPTGLSATPDTLTPAVVLEWTMGTVPDTVTVVRDGKVLDALLDPADLHIGGTTYRYVDWTATPLEEHSYRIRAVEDGEHSAKSAAAAAATAPDGVWLIDPTSGVWISASGVDGLEEWRRTDVYALYQPVRSGRDAAAPVKVTSSVGGISGSFRGQFFDGDADRSVVEQAGNLQTLLTHPDRELRLVAGDLNIPVIVADLSLTPHLDVAVRRDRAAVGWSFWQSGEFPGSD